MKFSIKDFFSKCDQIRSFPDISAMTVVDLKFATLLDKDSSTGIL